MKKATITDQWGKDELFRKVGTTKWLGQPLTIWKKYYIELLSHIFAKISSGKTKDKCEKQNYKTFTRQ